MKELAKDSYDLQLLEREILIMKDLDHPGIIGLKEVSCIFFFSTINENSINV